MTYFGKTYEEAVDNALKDLKVSLDEIDIEVVQKGKKSLLKFLQKDYEIHVSLKSTLKDNTLEIDKEVTDDGPISSDDKKAIEAKISYAKAFLNDLIIKLGYSVEILFQQKKDDIISIQILGDNLGPLIGRRGETLYNLQYLLNIIVNKSEGPRVKFYVDIENFKRKREKTLINLSKSIANKVDRTGEDVELEPMNPLERKIIHSTLQNDDRVSTESVGNEGNRYIVVKKI